jgi:hypothetical protein
VRYRIRKKFRRRFSYTPNLRNPESYCEKIQWLKLHHNEHDAELIARTDKYAVRKRLEEMGLGEHLVTLYGVYQDPGEINWEKLPKRFVLKLNNGSGKHFRWFVADKAHFPVAKFEARARKRLRKTFGEKYGETHYGKIPPRIIAEEYLEDQEHTFKDFKFYCFHGKVAFLSVEEGAAQGPHLIEYYNADWDPHPVGFSNDYPHPQSPFKKPRNFKRMVSIAETLSEGYPHVRVDLYNVEGRIYFGELTFTPERGFVQWNPPSLDFEYGKLMDITNMSQHEATDPRFGLVDGPGHPTSASRGETRRARGDRPRR